MVTTIGINYYPFVYFNGNYNNPDIRSWQPGCAGIYVCDDIIDCQMGHTDPNGLPIPPYSLHGASFGDF